MKSRTLQRVMATLFVVAGSWLGSSVADARVRVPAGTPIDVQIDTKISTQNNGRGDMWVGTVAEPVFAGGEVAIPAGTRVEGVVTSIAHGTHQAKPHLGLAVRRIYMEGRGQLVSADTQPIVAGSRRAKKLGAVAGGAAVGALLGRAVGGGKGTVIGGVLGGAAGYGATRNALRTLQIKPGTVVRFTTRETVYAYN